MKLGMAILFAVALFGLTSMVAFRSWGMDIKLSWLVVVGTSVWLAEDSARIQLRRYQTDLAVSPVSLLFGSLLLWIVVFPWYLSVRGQIKNGTAVLKDEVVKAAV